MMLFGTIAAITLASSVAAVTLRNLVHCALALAVALAGLATMYLALGAQFVGFAQVLVYIGAVAILIVFAILLTRGADSPREPLVSSGWATGLAIAAAVFVVLTYVVLSSGATAVPSGSAQPANVRQLGEEQMTRYVLPLEVLGLLLTAALIGAVIIALREPGPE